MDTSRRNQLRPALPRFLTHGTIVLWTVVVTIPLVTYFAADRWFYEVFVEHFFRPSVEQAYGFTAQRLPEWNGRHSNTPFLITSVTAGGAFASSGVHVGDIPASGFHHGNHAFALYGPLWHARGADVSMRFFRGQAQDPVHLVIHAPKRTGNA